MHLQETLIPNVAAAYVWIPRKMNGVVRYLFMQRTEDRYLGGTWGPPGGRLNTLYNGDKLVGFESAEEAAGRELNEEVGLCIPPSNLRLVATVERMAYEGNHIRTESYLHTTRYTEISEPRIGEPSKCAALGWFALHELPEQIAPPVALFLSKYEQRMSYRY